MKVIRMKKKNYEQT